MYNDIVMHDNIVKVCLVCGGRGEYREAYDYLGEDEAWVIRKCEDCKGRGWIEIESEEK